MSTDFIVEYEESQWEPGRWRELLRVAGNQATADVVLNGHLNYQFRVYAVNAVGPGPPSEPTKQYKTPPAGKAHSRQLTPFSCGYLYVMRGFYISCETGREARRLCGSFRFWWRPLKVAELAAAHAAGRVCTCMTSDVWERCFSLDRHWHCDLH